ncbi:MAG: hypothetical protein ASUL_09464 [Candidatus Aramenus sulfurataquae]|uniref:Uncharacterized protein n=1 Tax=Candidatus Aramenus sulfurataquae TaxID=1326980 RepID=W7L4F1_9CREN|nr:MAG: hypothetical protein ASUL_09464 [Candidatus Aramenus sulfurataquae]
MSGFLSTLLKINCPEGGNQGIQIQRRLSTLLKINGAFSQTPATEEEAFNSIEDQHYDEIKRISDGTIITFNSIEDQHTWA